MLQDLAVELCARRLPGARVAEKHPIHEHWQRCLAVKFAVVVGTADCHKVCDGLLDSGPTGLLVDLVQHLAELWVVPGIFAHDVSDVQGHGLWVEVGPTHGAGCSLLEPLTHFPRVAKALPAGRLEQPANQDTRQPRVGLRPLALFAHVCPYPHQLPLIEVLKDDLLKTALEAIIVRVHLGVHVVLVACQNHSKPVPLVFSERQ
mmetsp:Transcript_47437/g.135366  ORF Transcript_47437/g.135366 Transcript_47437/m.135366 type:complete len:204 (+) Transcript_47437:1446-2057(+)